jgi:DNA-directed RNA polymerase specialized sigma24 family protein
MSEAWIEIPETEGRYSVSNYGNVRANWSDIPQRNLSHRKRIEAGRQMKAWVHTTGYLRVGLGRGNQKYVHRLVAFAFLPNPESLPQVDHKDGDRQNNHVDNLQWVSAKDNAKYGGERHDWKTQKLASAKRRVYDLRKKEFEALLSQGCSLRSIAKTFGTSHSTVRATLSRPD